MLTAEERARGQRLGAVLRQARGERSMVEVAALAGVPVETLRKIETGRIPTPAFFTVVALAEAVGVPLGALAATAAPPPPSTAPAARPLRLTPGGESHYGQSFWSYGSVGFNLTSHDLGGRSALWVLMMRWWRRCRKNGTMLGHFKPTRASTATRPRAPT